MKKLLLVLVLACAGADLSAAENLLSPAARVQYHRYDSGAKITGCGSAVAIDLSAWNRPGRRYLLSAAHCVLDDKGTPYAELNAEVAGVFRPVKVLAADTELDLCVLVLPVDAPEIVVLAKNDVAPETAVILAGSARGMPLALYAGKITRQYWRGSIWTLAQVAYDHGVSGGPFYDKAGKLVGIATNGIPQGHDMAYDKGLFVPASVIRVFLDRVLK